MPLKGEKILSYEKSNPYYGGESENSAKKMKEHYKKTHKANRKPKRAEGDAGEDAEY